MQKYLLRKVHTRERRKHYIRSKCLNRATPSLLQNPLAYKVTLFVFKQLIHWGIQYERKLIIRIKFENISKKVTYIYFSQLPLGITLKGYLLEQVIHICNHDLFSIVQHIITTYQRHVASFCDKVTTKGMFHTCKFVFSMHSLQIRSDQSGQIASEFLMC